MDVATRKKSFLRSDVISKYKEVHGYFITWPTIRPCEHVQDWNSSMVILSLQVQIHGPVSLSENVDCIVVNERHKSCPVTVKLLEEFVEKNQCNLIWMEPLASIDYPRFGTTWHPIPLASIEYWFTQALTSHHKGSGATHWLPKLWDHVTFMYYSIIQCMKSFINYSIIRLFDQAWENRQFARAQFRKKRCVNI